MVFPSTNPVSSTAERAPKKIITNQITPIPDYMNNMNNYILKYDVPPKQQGAKFERDLLRSFIKPKKEPVITEACRVFREFRVDVSKNKPNKVQAHSFLANEVSDGFFSGRIKAFEGTHVRRVNASVGRNVIKVADEA